MTTTVHPGYPGFVRLLLAGVGIVLIIVTFSIMSHLTIPGVYVKAMEIVKTGPQSANKIDRLSFFNFKNYLYLVGPINSAVSDQETGPLFINDDPSVFTPSTFMDKTGALEILLKKPLFTEGERTAYVYKQPYHLIGWRVGPTGYSLMAIAKSQEGLIDVLTANAKEWKKTLLVYGLILAVIVFSIFWLLNMALLSTPYLETIQLLIVNAVFLVLFYTVLLLAGYPLFSTVIQTLIILVLSNALFIPLSLLIKRND